VGFTIFIVIAYNGKSFDMADQESLSSLPNDSCDETARMPSDVTSSVESAAIPTNPTVLESVPERPTKRDLISDLATFFEEATSRGLFPLVAYGLDNEDFLVLTTSIADLPLGMGILREINKDYNLGRSLQINRIE
jgi:hypothetical protein